MPLLKQRPVPDTQLEGSLPGWFKTILTARGIDRLDQLDYDFRHLPPPTSLLGADEAARLLADALANDAPFGLVGIDNLIIFVHDFSIPRLDLQRNPP